MADSIEAAIFSALKDIQNGISQRKAAARWGIPRSTLQKRLNGSQPSPGQPRPPPNAPASQGNRKSNRQGRRR
ncbi:hypothetical protein ACQKWADRAFT_305439 [Trichoderma austrokoningii]